ncbi:MAG: DUF429 domain-containing protein [Pseudomonadota bacterium]|nr:DUF429 domain-containing protein [Pseudomonadota bacterium]
MLVYGIDFTSRPSKQKPITCLRCLYENRHLEADSLLEWTDFSGFEDVLGSTGCWIMGIDAPFGQARRFVENIGWPMTWEGYVDRVAKMSREDFRQALNDYRLKRPPGDKEHRRVTDMVAKSLSPQKLFGTPVGLMFYEVVPRLLKANITIPSLHSGDKSRIGVEAYPGLLARHLIGRRNYKQDAKAKQTKVQYAVRQELHKLLQESTFKDTYGMSVNAPGSLVEDPTGDRLDALFCAIQAAWAWSKKKDNYGMPRCVDPLEGWIADATLASSV